MTRAAPLRPRVLMALAAMLVAAAAALAVLALSRPGGPAAEVSATALEGPLMPPGVRAASFRLRDQAGRSVSLSQFRGRVVVLTFMHALCTGSCPIIAQQVRGALDDLGPRAKQVQALAMSIEPIEDTPATVNRFLRRQHVAGRLEYLLGTRRRLAPLWRAYAIQPVATHSRHSTFTFLIDRRGVERVGYPLDALTPEHLAHDIGVLLAER